LDDDALDGGRRHYRIDFSIADFVIEETNEAAVRQAH